MMLAHEFTLVTCCAEQCGITFAVPDWWVKGKKQTHSWFYCPNGHHQHYPQESDLEKVRQQRDIARQQIARAEDEARAAVMRAERAEKANVRLEKRASAGTCPCCQRTFSNMTRHMKQKHPDFSTGKKLTVVK